MCILIYSDHGSVFHLGIIKGNVQTVCFDVFVWIVLTVHWWKETDAVPGSLEIILWWLIPATSHSYITSLTQQHTFRMSWDFLLFTLVLCFLSLCVCVCVCVWLQLIDTFSTEISELKQEMVQPAREPETEILHRWVLPSSPSSSSSLELMGYITFTFSHLPHTFIQSDLQMRTILHGVVCVLKD